jgi:type IV pilus assembly protein PilB
MKFGEYLVDRGHVKPTDVERALLVQRYTREPIGRALESLGVIDLSKLDEALKGFFRKDPETSLDQIRAMKVSDNATTSSFGSSKRFIIRELDSETLVAIGNEVSDADLRQIEAATSRKCMPLYVSAELWSFIPDATELRDQKTTDIQLRAMQGDDESLSRSGAYTALYRDAIRAAHAQKASDIHVKPTVNGVEIAFRVHGTMSEPWKTLSSEHRQSFLNEVKRLTNLSIAISGKAQDSRVSYPSLNLDLRVNLIPSLYGEKVVMRLLDLSRSFSMEKLQIDQRAKDDFSSVLRLKNGVVLISGPTGSGKTTTLYTAVSSLDRKKLNILTVEDPIEYTIPGITQIGINRKLSFASALRAILRQDPDVILVGEVRDEETADLCFKAASTGHLVLSTVHANGSVEVVQRLLGLGVEKYLLTSCLRFSAAQRIVRQLCPACSIEAPLEKIPKRESDVQQGTFRIVGSGCQGCREGYIGLLPILEYMGTSEIQDYAANGFSGVASPKVSLKEAFYAFARRGIVDVTEVHEIG